jgi:RHS repeat-associated protein
VEVNSGRQTEFREDLAIPGRLPVSVAPFYSSASEFLGVHGFGYSSYLTMRLIQAEDSTWILRNERGDREDFDKIGKNLKHRTSMSDLVLTADSAYWEPVTDRVYVFTRRGGVLASYRDRRGGGVVLTYDDSAGTPVRRAVKGISYSAWPAKYRGTVALDYRVKRIASLDNSAQYIDLGYDTSGLLTTAKDFTGRQVSYVYDPAGNQTKVTFPDGTLRRFSYLDSSRIHRLTSFDANPIRSSLVSDTTIMTKNVYGGQNRVSGQTYQGAKYDFNRDNWWDSTFRTSSIAGQPTPPAGSVWRVTIFLRSTMVQKDVPIGSGIPVSRKSLYRDSIVNFGAEDSKSGKLIEPMRWHSRTLMETETVGSESSNKTTIYDNLNNVASIIQPDGTRIVFTRDTLYRVSLQTETPTAGRGTPRYIRYTYEGSTSRVLRQVDGTASDSIAKEWTYDAMGNTLTESVWRDPAQKTITSKTYDAAGRLLTETDPFGKVTKSIYLTTTSMQPDSVQFPDSTGERYARDALGRIVQTRNQLGQVRWAKYDVMGRDTVACGYDSLCSRRSYNGPDLVQLEEGLKATSTGGYNSALRVAKYDADGYGRRVKEWLKAGSRWVLKRKMVLDALGNELEAWDNPDSTNTDTTKWRLVERKVFDGRNRLRERRQFPNGTAADSLVTKYSPDANGNVAAETDPRGGKIRRVIDPWGGTVSDTDAVNRTTSRTYDHRGLVVTENDAAGHSTSHEYDALGNEIRRIGWHADTTLRMYDRGRLVKECTPEGSWTTYQYDVRGRVVRVAQKVGDTALAIDSNDVFTDYTYDKLGRRIKESLRGIALHRFGHDAGGRVVVDTNASGTRSNNYYDALGRIGTANNPAGFGVVTEYDNQGRVKIRRIGTDTLSVSRYDDADRPVWERTPGQGAVSRTYDKTDYVTSTVDSVGLTTTIVQDRMGRDSLVSVAGKTARKTVRDAVGRVIEQWDERGYKVSMGYDALDRLITLQDNESNTTTFTYVDSAGGWRRTTTYPDSKQEHHIYDREGRLRKFVDGRGFHSVYKYDSLSRLKGIDFLTSTGTVAATSVTLSYDRLGRFCKAVQGSLTDSMAYDNYGRVVSNRQTVNGGTYVIGYSYDEYNRKRTLTLPDGTTIKQKWTPRGLVDSLWSGSRLMARYGYKFGLETSRNLSNGIALAEGYDAAGRLASLVYTLTGQTLPNLGFGYDASGNRKLIRRNHYTTTSEAIGYTTDNQVSTWGQGTADANGAIATPTASQAWTLDSRGNWSGWTQNGTAQTRTHTVANELTAMGAAALTWDAAGNLTSDGKLAYVWGARGLLDTAKQGTTVKGIYTYDPLGRRAMKTVGALKTISVYDGWQCVYQKVTGSGTDTTKIFAYGNYIDEPVAMIRKWGTTTDTVWYLQGNNYNVEALTDRTGAVVERYEYSPYGKVTVYTGKGADAKWFTADDVTASVSAKGNALTFQGRELDAETGNLYFRNRNFSLLIGRFVSRDPIRFKADVTNMYRFVYSDPFDLSDPMGLKCVLISREELTKEKVKLISVKSVGYQYRTFRSVSIKVIRKDLSAPNTPGYNRLTEDDFAGYCIDGKVGEWFWNKWRFRIWARVKRKCCEGCEATQTCTTFESHEESEEERSVREYLPYPQPRELKMKYGFAGTNACKNSEALPQGFQFGE